MYTVRYGGKDGRPHRFEVADDLVVVRTRLAPSLGRAIRSRIVAEVLGTTRRIAHFPDAGVEVLRVLSTRKRRVERDRIRRALGRQKGVEFAGRVLCDGSSALPVVYTENLFVKFADRLPTAKARGVLRRHGLELKRAAKGTRNAYFVGARRNTGLKVFALANRLLRLPEVELCHPELVRPVGRKRAFPRQWHLHRTRVNGRIVDADANVKAAWRLATGKRITIAVIDDGFDLGHQEFRPPSKIVAPRDVTQRDDDPSPFFFEDNHGTACAGVACARGRYGASGVAPDARLMPIRLMSGLGSQAEADAFVWAADKGADVISCSWGPEDGDWWDPRDPLHRRRVPLPDSTRVAIEYAIRKGRGGKGCVITWAAGNGNESVDNDGYASNEKVIAVAACSDRSKRSAYSDYGKAILCAFPSDDVGPPEPRTPGIWTTDRTGAFGYNPNEGGGDRAGNYTEDFGGTSSACPGVAGVAALMLSRNRDLTWQEVRELIARSCRQIDRAKGRYRNGRSDLYGHGRVDARRAVELAAAAGAPAGSRRKRTRRRARGS